jgi:hypothetical protein
VDRVVDALAPLLPAARTPAGARIGIA